MKNNLFRIVSALFIVLMPNIATFTAYAGPYDVPAKIPDTGITKCYDDSKEIPCPQPGEDYYGQDGNYNINPMSYTKLDAQGNDLPDSAASWVMVRDNVTGLIWEMKANLDDVKNYADPHDADNTYTWYDPDPATNGGYAGTAGTDTKNFIDALNAAKFGGYSDWRMPGREELRSIVNYSKYSPAIDTVYFPNIKSSSYWSSSTYAYNTSKAWRVNFVHGADNYSDKSNSYYVRAVRGGQAATLPRFTDNGNGTVTDIRTGLMWQQATGSNGAAMTWKAALAYCENLSLAGYTDWRLPNIRELASLADLSRYNPAINTGYFPDTKSDNYWSSSTYANYTGYAWGVYFSYGYGYNDLKSYYSYYVRAVRGGQSGVFGNSGDLNHLNGVDLADAVLALKVICGLNPSGVFLDADVNGDGKIGLAEVIYILQKVAGLR